MYTKINDYYAIVQRVNYQPLQPISADSTTSIMRHARVIGNMPARIIGTHAPVPFAHLTDHVRSTWIDSLKHDLITLRDKEYAAAHEQHGFDNHYTAREHSARAAHIQRLLNGLIAATSNTIVVKFTAQAQSPSDYADARAMFDRGECITQAEDPHYVIRDYIDDVTDMYNAYDDFTQWIKLHHEINDILQAQRWNVAIIFRIVPAA